MTQPLRIESPDEVNLVTSRTENSLLWFINNEPLTEDILGALAKYQSDRNVKLFAFNLQGNHPHILAQYPDCNRAAFMRDFNARIAWLSKFRIKELGRGKFWERRYSNQILPRNQDIEEYFFYCALQPVQSGLVEKIEDYPGYNSFDDAVSGIDRTFKVVNWTAYNNAKRFNPEVEIEEYTSEYTLRYERLPGYEHLTQSEYKKLMYRKLEGRRKAIVKRRLEGCKAFLGRQALLRTKRGSAPKTSKCSTRYSHRPLVLTACIKTKHAFLNQYFTTLALYKRASRRFLRGMLEVIFPYGTYAPPRLCLWLVEGRVNEINFGLVYKSIVALRGRVSGNWKNSIDLMLDAQTTWFSNSDYRLLITICD